MFEFIKIQFALQRISAEQVYSFAPRWITAEQAEQIVAGKGK